MTTSCLPRALRFLAIAVLTLTALGLRAASPATFDIPPQPAPAALKQFIKQSGTQVVYIQDDLKAVTTKAVKGDLNPAAALAQLLDGTGFAVETMANGNFTISRPVALKPGSIEGTIRDNDSGRAVAGARVAIAGTDLSVLSDKRGRFTFAEAPTGDHALEITADGIQNTRVTDVSVKTGHRLTLSTISVPVKSAGAVELDPYTVSAKKNDGVVELDPYSVEGRKEKPFTVNMDIPRTINDAQPYYIFDTKAIDQSGATNVEDFLKQRLTMNSLVQSESQITTGASSRTGAISTVNLRGLGADKTLILINGRRAAGVPSVNASNSTFTIGAPGQPDLNGIPIGAIDRIEILPSSASGIYGASALGGVINVVLKKNYTGGELRLGYQNTVNSDAPTRSANLSYGLSVNGGKTQLMVTAQVADKSALLLQDRRQFIDRAIANVTKYGNLAFLGNFVGSLPNITSNNGANLVLKDGAPLGSMITFVPSGTSSSTPIANLRAGLIANAGKLNLDVPPTAQSPTGLYRQLTFPPTTVSFSASLKQQVFRELEITVDWSHNENGTTSFSTGQTTFSITSGNPNNPFNNPVRITLPDAPFSTLRSKTFADTVSLGLVSKLPADWTAQADITWSRTRLISESVQGLDSKIRTTAAFNSSGINPFIDSLANPINLQRYNQILAYDWLSILKNATIRASGPLPKLPWGDAHLTVGLEYRDAMTPANTANRIFPVTTADNVVFTNYERHQETESLYTEALVPLVKNDWLPFVHSLTLQLSGRMERFTVDGGTTSKSVNIASGVVNYSGITLNGQPYFKKDKYRNINETIALKYEPTKDIIVRASFGTAFLPPTPAQLILNPVIDGFLTDITDPTRNNATVSVQTISGGNPDLIPQTATSLNVGFVWAPTLKPLRGFRLNVEHYKISQKDEPGTISAQVVVNNPNVFGSRITRDAAGNITLIDLSTLNLYKRETEGWDLSASYTRKTPIGEVTLQAAQSIIERLETQYDLNTPSFDAVNFPSEGGAAKYKSSGIITLEKGDWIFGWSTSFIGSYKQYGAKGGPDYTQRIAADPNAAQLLAYITQQGGDTIPSQSYSDAFVGYRFRANSGRGASLAARLYSDTLIQVGVKNIFNRLPPYDFYYDSSYYTSPYGDLSLRSYWVSIRKSF